MTAEVGETTRRVARNAVISGAGEVVGKVATFAVIAFAARELAVADFGAFSFAFALCLLIATLPGWGLAVVLMHEGAAQPEKMQRFLAQVITVRMVAGIPITAAVWLFASRHDPASDRSVMLISLLLAVVVLGELQQTARSAATGRQRLGGVTLALIADRVVTAGIGIVALRAGAGVVGLGIAFTAGALVSCAGSFYVLARIGVTPDFSGMNARDLVRLIRRTTFAGLDEMIAMALFRLDAVLLGWMDGDAAVATYAAGYRLLETVLFISWAISRAVSPAMSANAEPWRVRRGVEQGSALAAFCYLPFIASF